MQLISSQYSEGREGCRNESVAYLVSERIRSSLTESTSHSKDGSQINMTVPILLFSWCISFNIVFCQNIEPK